MHSFINYLLENICSCCYKTPIEIDCIDTPIHKEPLLMDMIHSDLPTVKFFDTLIIKEY